MQIDQRTKALLIIGGVLGVIAFFIFTAILLPAPRKETSQQAPKILTEDETRLPEAKPQHLTISSGKTGTLVVTANLTGGYVFIDQPMEAYPEGAPVAGQPAPMPPQYPPFRVTNVPVGQHKLIGIREGSTRQDIDFEIKENEITRIQISYKQSW